MTHFKSLRFTTLFLSLLLCTGANLRLARAEEAPAPAPASTADSSPEAEELEKIKQRYWAQGNEKEMGVVQNRLFTKEGRSEITLIGGILSSDPFLNVRTVGASLGYHLDETFSFLAFGWKNFSSASSALTKLEQGGKKANTNSPFSTFGAEARASLLYGKLSLLGRKILYYDMYAGIGGAISRTQNGTYPGPMVSIGQHFFISNNVTFGVDYRLIAYREDIIEREVTPLLGQNVGKRNNYSNSLSIGFSFLFGGPSK